MSFSLYIHIPYCQSKCPYCDFNSYAASSWPEAEYTKAVIEEMRFRADAVPWAGEHIKTIFFGGGTPSLFEPDSVAAIVNQADRLFGVDAAAEITLEANPGTVSAAKLNGFKAAGANRISFGAQSFDPGILKFLGRIHNADDTRTAARLAHQAGFERINLDLIFAVPGQQLEHVGHDINETAKLEPDHISAYNLTFEEGTSFFTDLKRGRIRPLPSDDQAAMFDFVREELPRRGYPMYEISNYAPRGHEARHNLTYWKAESYLGLGAGAHSFFGANEGSGRRWWNQRLPARYITSAKAGRGAEAASESIDQTVMAGEFVFLNLRLRQGFELAEFERRFGETFGARFGARSARLFEGGVLLLKDGRVFLSDRGVEIADSVFAEFV
jgi:oxygen-independent coproporphyrinogen III oxidase